MKTLTLALFAVSLTVAPIASAAMAQDAAPAAAAAVEAPANKTAVSKKWAVGERMPGAFVIRSNQANAEALNLPAAPVGYKWYHVTDNAYLINVLNDHISKIVGVPAKTKA